MTQSDEAYVPTPDEIKARCAEIQAEWTANERLKRGWLTLDAHTNLLPRLGVPLEQRGKRCPTTSRSLRRRRARVEGWLQPVRLGRFASNPRERFDA